MKATQGTIILDALKHAGSQGLHPTYFISTLHIFQYSARIAELRQQLDCRCRHNIRCNNRYHIVNKTMPNETTRFYFIDDTEKLKKENDALMNEYREKTKLPEADQDSLF